MCAYIYLHAYNHALILTYREEDVVLSATTAVWLRPVSVGRSCTLDDWPTITKDWLWPAALATSWSPSLTLDLDFSETVLKDRLSQCTNPEPQILIMIFHTDSLYSKCRVCENYCCCIIVVVVLCLVGKLSACAVSLAALIITCML